MKENYIVITPVKNEAKYINLTIDSMIQQSVKPAKWIIVDDGSSDNTAEIVELAAQKYNWISVIKKKSTEARAPGANVVKAFNYGLSIIDMEYDYIVKLDGDLEFESKYFENLLIKFDLNDRLGIAGGYCVDKGMGKKKKIDNTPEFHVRGATKMYRKKCFHDIGGLLPKFGWDGIDEIKAMMLGWETQSFREIVVKHLRPTGQATGLLRYAWRRGDLDYYMGYNPIYLMMSCIKNFSKKPYFLFGFVMFSGYLFSYIKSSEQINDKNFIEFIKKFQKQRIKNIFNNNILK
jgi:poly-beta-1,6-N-acetyl-D-glucosamine synthase